MEARTVLLTLHIAAVAGWLGADLLQYALSPRLARESPDVALAWARHQEWVHGRYYPVVVVLVAITGILLVLDGDWEWSSGFVAVGFSAIIGAAILGGGGLGRLTKQRVAALEAGDVDAAAAAERRTFRLSLLVTALPVIALVAMVDKWQA